MTKSRKLVLDRDSVSNFILRPPPSCGRSAVRIVDSSSRNAVSFSSACTMKRFPRFLCRRWRIIPFGRTSNGIHTFRQKPGSLLLGTAPLAPTNVAIHPRRQCSAAKARVAIHAQYDSPAFSPSLFCDKSDCEGWKFDGDFDPAVFNDISTVNPAPPLRTLSSQSFCLFSCFGLT